MKQPRGGNMRWIWAILLLPMAFGAVFLTGTSAECTVLKPGETQVYVLAISQPTTGTYSVVLNSNGLIVEPKEMTLNLQADLTDNRWIRVTAPGTVFDSYYTLEISVYDTANNTLVESEQYCFRVFSGYTSQPDSIIAFGYKGIRAEGDKIFVTLYVTNLSNIITTVDLYSDYSNVIFEENPVVVPEYTTREITVEIPVKVSMPEFVKFFARIGDVEKNVVVKLPVETVKRVEVEFILPDTIVTRNTVERIPVRVTNFSDVKTEISFKGYNLPPGSALLSEYITLDKGETRAVDIILKLSDIKETGVFTPRICAVDKYGAILSCKFIVIEVPDRKVVEAKENVTQNSYEILIRVQNGAKKQENVKVEVSVPEGWKYTASPDVISLEPYGSGEVRVSFTPEANAVDGVAVVKLVAPDGTVLAQRTVSLRKSALTGYVTLTPTANTVLALILALIVIGAIAYIIRRGKRAEEVMEFEELTKKE